MKEVSWITWLLGIWLILAPWVLHFGSGAMVANNAMLGLWVVVIAGLSLLVADANHGFAWINVVSGAWVFVSPWILGYHATAALWNDAIVGALIVLFALVRSRSGRPVMA